MEPVSTDLRTRARRAYERSISDDPPEDALPPDPEVIARMERALRKLPRVTREVFLAVRFDRKSYADIASVTGLSVTQVERQIAKAILALHNAACDGGRPKRQPVWRTWLARIFR